MTKTLFGLILQIDFNHYFEILLATELILISLDCSYPCGFYDVSDIYAKSKQNIAVN